MTFTATDKADCARREAKLRRRVFPRWIEQGRMKPEFAEREIALMEDIERDYRALAEAERLNGDLFRGAK